MAATHPYPVQLVQPDGRRVHDPRYAPLVADIGPQALRDLYRDMTVVRRLDTEATALQRQGELGLWAPLTGQEAAQVGSAHALEASDYVFTSYREHGVAWVRGVDPADMTRMWRGCAHAGWNPDSVNTTNPAIVVGSQGLHATGYAMGAKLDGVDIATIVYFGDGATSQGDLSEALGFAVSWGVGVVFFCQNNQWAISVPTHVQSPVPLAQRAAGFGMPSVQVDGNDVLAVLAVTRQATRHARDGAGPFFVEALTYRMGPHTTSDDPTRYRTASDLDEWTQRDPLDRIHRLLEREALADEEFFADTRRIADDVAARLRAATISMPDPPPEALFENVYATTHHTLDEQRAEYLRYLNEEVRS